ncbi:hypothetical protein GCM10022284_50170 [Streptomyces hundungensis]
MHARTGMLTSSESLLLSLNEAIVAGAVSELWWSALTGESFLRDTTDRIQAARRAALASVRGASRKSPPAPHTRTVLKHMPRLTHSYMPTGHHVKAQRST